MAPNLADQQTGVLYEDDNNVDTELVAAVRPDPEKRKVQLVWRNIFIASYFHIGALYGLYLCFYAQFYSILFAFVLYKLGGIGVNAGAHRLWSHRSFKAKWPLLLFLTVCETLAFQNTILDWARDHRVHHKYAETDADPYNAKRGFFFAHVGWLLCIKHPQVKIKGRGIDLSDLYADPFVFYQKKYYWVLMPIACFLIPTVIPMYFWGESLCNSWHICVSLRYCININSTWSINSAAHLWGNKPYDKNINPAQNLFVSIVALGEGWHNFHHTFPWDYRAAEVGSSYATNEACLFLDAMKWLGLAYELKTVNEDTVKRRVLRTGDGTHPTWGWGDKDQTQEERNAAVIIANKDN